MMKKRLLTRGLAALFMFSAVSCGTDTTTETVKSGTGITDQSWSATETFAADGQTKTYTFTVDGAWTASCPKTWCEVLTPEGAKGTATLQIKAQANGTNSQRVTTVTIKANNYSKGATLIISQPAAASSTWATLNKQIDDYLVDYYLWNTEYKTLTRDLSIPFVASPSSNFLKTTLMKMTTNIYDKKTYYDGSGNPYQSLYSFIQQTSAGSASSGTAPTSAINFTHGQKKEYDHGFGINYYTLYGFLLEEGSKNACITIFVVYPDSPAALAGVKRGWSITEIDGVVITTTNFNTMVNKFHNQTGTMTMKFLDNDNAEQTKTLTAADFYPNPVLKSDVVTSGTHKIGYIAYNEFDAGYDEDLLNAIKKVKDGGATDLVLDLRYNGGGHVISAQMLSSCIAGADCNNKVFHYYSYNPNRMATPVATAAYTGNTYDSEAKLFYENFIYDGKYWGVDLKPYSLNVNKKLYVLCSGNTASASEMTAYSLKGIGFDVVFIGEQTSGKNVGMEPRDVTDGNGGKYLLAPITFQGYNAQKVSVPHTGIAPNAGCEIDEIGAYIDDFGAAREPLFAKAVSLITGQPVAKAPKTRAVATPLPMQKMESNRLTGMIKFPAAAKE